MKIENGVLTNVEESDIMDGFFDIPSSVTTIGEHAFHRCKSLIGIDIPASVTTIGDQAFSFCESLVTIYIPSSVTTIGNGAFYICKSLVNINIPSSVTAIDEWTFAWCESLANINIPSSVTTIGNNAFAECKNIININIPSSVTTIGNDAFWGCKSLANINIPSSVTTIGNRLLCGCKSLINIDIPSSVASIGDSAFAFCESLADINIPTSVTSIDQDAFWRCKNLKEITITNADGQTVTYKPQCIDGIPTLIQSKKTTLNGITIYKGQTFNGMENGSINLEDCYVAESDEVFAHGTTLKDAVSDMTFKIARERGQEQYSHLTLDSIVSFDDAKIAYRMITGACDMGTNQFIESLSEIKDSYTIRELIALTDGQYGSDMFKEFFDD